jgi:hypothetical protein
MQERFARRIGSEFLIIAPNIAASSAPWFAPWLMTTAMGATTSGLAACLDR